MSNLRKAWNLYNLMRSQWKSYEELRELQNQKLRFIIRHAYENVPLYREKFDRREIHPEDVKTVEDLPKLPITTKQEVKDNFPHRIVARGTDIKKCWLPDTSGSTGTPLAVAYDEAAEDFQKAVALRPNLSCGQGLFDKWIQFVNPRYIVQKRYFQRLGLFNPIRISLLEDIHKQLSILKDVSPKIIESFPSHLYILAREIIQEGISINPQIIFTSGELLDTQTRNFIELAFNSTVYDQFGGVELGRTAWECPAHSGYHIDVEAVVIELIRDRKQALPDEMGEIVYTGLYNYAMPLIRYACSDIGKLSNKTCPCRRGLPLMEVVAGRKDDFLVSSDGAMVCPMVITDPIVKNETQIDQCKVIQERKDLIVVQIVERLPLTIETQGEIVSGIKRILGSDVEVHLQKVSKLEKDESGKLRKVISKVKLA